ncbi:MAG: nucleotidyltransferase domain-containing protein, partial [Chloroflexi bacterium]|nr:nucleotidyltransferase domain-containing protein [Chloroflexota bacterium]
MTQATGKVIEEIKQKARPILSRYGAKRAGLFGSVVRGKTRKKSDIDILVELDQEIGLLEFIRIQRELE